MNFQHSFIARQKKHYYKIGFILCAALNNEKIYFNNHGFNHLTRKNRKLRKFEEQRYRFSLLKHCPAIFQNPTVNIEYRVIENQDSIAKFWTIKSATNQRNIKIVIRQVNNGNKHFFSIFTYKDKTPR